MSSPTLLSVIVPPVLEAPASPPPLNKGALVDWYDNYISFSCAQERKQRAEEFFQAVTFQATDPAWFGPHRIPDAFRNRHAMITMHLWFLHKRLISDTSDPQRARAIQEELFSILWEDTAIRVRREPNVSELMVNKNVSQVQQYTWIHLTHYDHVFSSKEFLEAPRERFQKLYELLARHVLVEPGDSKTFGKTQESNAALVASKSQDLLERLAWYVDVQYQNICLEWPHEHYLQGRVAWVGLPTWEGLKDKDGKPVPAKLLHPANDGATPLPTPWLTNYTIKGDEYYWNPETDESQWERPTE